MERRLVAAFLLSTVLAFPTWADDQITSLTLFRDQAGKPGAEVKQFLLTDRKQHFSVKLKKVEIGRNKFQARFVGVETMAGNNQEIYKTSDLGTSLIADSVTASISLPRDWPLGRYAIEVLMNGKPIGTRTYIVSPDWADQKVGAWMLYGDDGKGNAILKPIPAFKPTQRTLHFEAQTNGYVPRGVTVTWVMTTEAGKEVVRIPFTVPSDSILFNRLTSEVSLPRDWPTGRYQMQLFDGKRSLGTHTFEIRA